jgi:hypothetical protein
MRKSALSRFNRRTWTAAAVSAAFLVPLGVFGGPALASSVAAASQYGGSSQYQYKVTICHRTHSKKHPFVQISVGAPAAKAHLRHGDTLGACPAPPAPAPITKHGDNGNSGDHGKSKGKSNDQSQSSNSQGNSSGHGNGKGNGHHK